MNVYHLDAGEQREAVYEDHENNVGHWEYFEAQDLIAAPSRGRAKSLFLDEFGMLDWTSSISIRLIEKDIDLPEGQVNDPTLWLQSSMIVHDMAQAMEWETWQVLYECGDLEGMYDASK